MISETCNFEPGKTKVVTSLNVWRSGLSEGSCVEESDKGTGSCSTQHYRRLVDFYWDYTRGRDIWSKKSPSDINCEKLLGVAATGFGVKI